MNWEISGLHHGGASRLRQARQGSITVFLGGDTSVCRRKQERKGGHKLKAKYLHCSISLSSGWPRLRKCWDYRRDSPLLASILTLCFKIYYNHFYIMYTCVCLCVRACECRCSQSQEGTASPGTRDAGSGELLAVGPGPLRAVL